MHCSLSPPRLHSRFLSFAAPEGTNDDASLRTSVQRVFPFEATGGVRKLNQALRQLFCSVCLTAVEKFGRILRFGLPLFRDVGLCDADWSQGKQSPSGMQGAT
jgi:hypothetical protein